MPHCPKTNPGIFILAKNCEVTLTARTRENFHEKILSYMKLFYSGSMANKSALVCKVALLVQRTDYITMIMLEEFVAVAIVFEPNLMQL